MNSYKNFALEFVNMNLLIPVYELKYIMKLAPINAGEFTYEITSKKVL